MSEKETTPDQHLVQTAQKIIEEAAKMIKDLLDALNNKLQKDAAAKVSAEQKKREREEMMEMISALLEKHGFKPTPENVDATAKKAERLNEIDQKIKAADEKINELDKKVASLDKEIKNEQGLDPVDEDKLNGLQKERGELLDQRTDEIAGISTLENEKEELLNDKDLAKSLKQPGNELEGPGDGLKLPGDSLKGKGDGLELPGDGLKGPGNDPGGPDPLDALDPKPANDIKGGPAPAAGADALKAPAVDAPAVDLPAAKLPAAGSGGIKSAVAGKALPAAAPALGAVADVADKGSEMADSLSGGNSEKLKAQAKKGPISKKLVEGKDFALNSVAEKIGSACKWLNSLKETIEGLKSGKESKQEKNSQKQRNSHKSSV